SPRSCFCALSLHDALPIFKIWDRVSDGVERDLLQKLKLLGGYFSDSGIQTEILQQQDIVRLCNLVNNPAYVHLEDSGINAAIPIDRKSTRLNSSHVSISYA